MPTSIALKERHTIKRLKEIVKKCADQAQKTRIRAIINIKKGKKRSEVAEILSCSRDSVTNWVNTYNEESIEGLKTNLGGRKEGNPKWDIGIFASLAEEIDKQKQYWSVPLMQKWIRENKKEEIPEQTVWYHMKDLRYSYKSARPHPHKGNREAQAAFKKGA